MAADILLSSTHTGRALPRQGPASQTLNNRLSMQGTSYPNIQSLARPESQRRAWTRPRLKRLGSVRGAC